MGLVRRCLIGLLVALLAVATVVSGAIYAATHALAATVRTIAVVAPPLTPKDSQALDGAIANWNRDGTADLYRADTCPATGECAVVSFGSVYGPDQPAVGLTQPWMVPMTVTYDAVWWDSTGPLIHHRASYHRALFCHELGHVLGLGHTGYGCMVPSPTPANRFAGALNRALVPAAVPAYGSLVMP